MQETFRKELKKLREFSSLFASSFSQFKERSDAEIFDLVSGMYSLKIDSVTNNPLPIVKNNKESESLRLKGNDLFKLKKYKLALNEYTKSLYYAETDSLEQKLAYANRSSLLFQRGYYAECLQDIDRALKNGNYPKNKQAQILDRQKKALDLLSQQKKKQFHAKVEPLTDKNPVVPTALSKIKISENEKYGKFIEATEDIEFGETLLIEQPYAFCVENKNLLEYCSACAEFCFNMIPCDSCFALYCSEKCKNEAFELYHKYECVVERYYIVNPSVLDKADHEVRLPLRSTLRALKDLKEKKHQRNVKQYHSDCYEEFKNLATHKEGYKSAYPVQFFSFVTEYVKVVHLLVSHTNIKQEFNVNVDTLKKLLMHNAQLKYFNNVSIVTLIGQKDQQYIAVAVYTVFSRFNHSCCPNATYSFYGNTIAVRAKRSIKKGQQIFVSYIPVYYDITRETRQERLSCHLFSCDCRACKDDWPLFTFDSRGIYLKTGQWSSKAYNLKLYSVLEEMLKKLNFSGWNNKLLSKDSYDLVWKRILKMYEKIKDEEPSPSFVLLDDLLMEMSPQCNRSFTF